MPQFLLSSGSMLLAVLAAVALTGCHRVRTTEVPGLKFQGGHLQASEIAFDPTLPLEIDVPRGNLRVRGTPPSVAAMSAAGASRPGIAPEPGAVRASVDTNVERLSRIEFRAQPPYQGYQRDPGVESGAPLGTVEERLADDARARAAGNAAAVSDDARRIAGSGLAALTGRLVVQADIRVRDRTLNRTAARNANASVVLVRETDRQVLRLAGGGSASNELDEADLVVWIDAPLPQLLVRTGQGVVEVHGVQAELDVVARDGAVTVTAHRGSVRAWSGRGDVDVRADGLAIVARADRGQVTASWFEPPRMVDLSASEAIHVPPSIEDVPDRRHASEPGHRVWAQLEGDMHRTFEPPEGK
ncbi:MAG: hypothetical protein AB8G96_10865 [Phycisphaerales bacterium]